MEKALEIILITYNRRKYLESTLNTIFSETSPLKKYQITILDNNSDDGTQELCESFSSKFSNLKYIKNKRNVGLSGNICKAMEFAEKKYLWIMCDNDKLDFSAWGEVEKAMEENNDLIIVSQLFRAYVPKNELEKFAYQYAGLMFLPAAIFKTSNITDFIMSYMMSEIPTCFPHMALVYEILNNNGKVAVLDNDIVKNQKNEDYSETHDRINDKRKHYSFKNGYIDASLNYLNTLKILKEKNLKQALVDISVAKYGFGYIDFSRLAKFYLEKKLTFPEILTIYSELNSKNKKQFVKKIIIQKLKKILKR